VGRIAAGQPPVHPFIKTDYSAQLVSGIRSHLAQVGRLIDPAGGAPRKPGAAFDPIFENSSDFTAWVDTRTPLAVQFEMSRRRQVDHFWSRLGVH
jgi:hypothetical protein